MNNTAVRDALTKTRVRYYELADRLGVSEQTLYRHLRKELPADRQQEMVNLIYEIMKERS